MCLLSDFAYAVITDPQIGRIPGRRAFAGTAEHAHGRHALYAAGQSWKVAVPSGLEIEIRYTGTLMRSSSTDGHRKALLLLPRRLPG
jgi:hypothetical protein